MLQKILLTCALFGFFPLSESALFCKSECKSSGRRCVDPYTYQLCINKTEVAVSSTDPKSCPAGTICTDVGSFPCKVGTVPEPTTPPPPPPCNGSGLLPGPTLTQYYDCQYIWFVWQAVLTNCPAGRIFNAQKLQCEVGEVPKPTTPPPPPICTGEGLLPGPTSRQYYECQYVWFQWQPYLQNCSNGQIFNVELSQCVIVTTTVAPKTTVVQPPVIPAGQSEPTCTGAGLLPGPSPNQYYECKYAWLKWQSYLLNCSDGQVFDAGLSQCVIVTTTTTTTTTVAPTTTTTTTVAPSTTTSTVQPPSVPTCTGAGLLPGPTSNQYYECKYAWLKWQAYLKSCPAQEIFDAASSQCVQTARVQAAPLVLEAPEEEPTVGQQESVNVSQDIDDIVSNIISLR